MTGSLNLVKLPGLKMPSKQSPKIATVISSYIISSCSIFLSNSHKRAFIISKSYLFTISLYIPLTSKHDPAWKSLKHMRAVELLFRVFMPLGNLTSMG